MNNQNDLNKIIEILKIGAVEFRNSFDKDLKTKFSNEVKEDEIIVHFKVWYGRELEYLINFRKQKVVADKIPVVKGYEKLSLTSNPFRQFKSVDEFSILGNIYEHLKQIKVDELVCYKKFGIILRNPLEMKGIYNINIKYVTD